MTDYAQLYADMVERSRESSVRDALQGAQTPLTFDVRLSSHTYQSVGLERAAMFKRQGCKVDGPNRPLTGSDFAEYGDRILLAELGYFSCDLPEAKTKRDQQAQIDAYIDEAYDVMGLDRKQQHALIAAKMEAKRFDGIWARSTGEYSATCRRLDEAMLAANPSIAKSVDELRNASRSFDGAGQ